MGRKKRTEIRVKQKNKRKKRRLVFLKKNKNPDEYFYNGTYVARPIK
ncbi:MAG: hypothetical protein NG740_04030 [Omnitrophica bacterium]|nr:hypothetical protein [Candidatus Omnitrophota bacterium]